MNIKKRFSLRNKKNGELLKCSAMSVYLGGSSHEVEYSLSLSGDFNWIVDKLEYALIVANEKKYNNSEETPYVYDRDKLDIEVVTLYEINNNFIFISSEYVPQSIYDFVKDENEAIKLSSYIYENNVFIENDNMFKTNMELFKNGYFKIDYFKIFLIKNEEINSYMNNFDIKKSLREQLIKLI